MLSSGRTKGVLVGGSADAVAAAHNATTTVKARTRGLTCMGTFGVISASFGRWLPSPRLDRRRFRAVSGALQVVRTAHHESSVHAGSYGRPGRNDCHSSFVSARFASVHAR